MKLTPKQQAFCDYFIETGNATEAAIKAGYNANTARFIGCENLTKPNIRKYIDQRMAEKEEERIASQDEVLQFLTAVLRGEVTEEVPIALRERFEMTNKKPSIHDRIKAAEAIGKRYGMFKDKVEHSGDLSIIVKPPDDWMNDDGG